MNKRFETIGDILTCYPNAFVILSNGLTSREAAYFYPNDRCFYLLHAMGEALSVGIGLALAQPNLEIVVIDGDGNALMGLSSWSLMPLPNLTYYVLENRMHETTGGQAVPKLPFVPEWCNVLKISPGKENTPNPPSPVDIWISCQNWLRRIL